MIVTFTPNPSVDRTLAVDALTLGAVQRAGSAWSEPSGKGVNVALALRAHGFATKAVLPIGGPEGDRLAAMLENAGVDHACVPIAGNIRSNISILEPEGRVTKVNEPGPELSPDEVNALLGTAVKAAAQARWLVGAGSLPNGTPPDVYARLIEQAHEAGLRVAIDSSGPPLLAALPAGPDLIKPNAHELAEAAGAPVTTLGEAVDAAHRLQEVGARTVLASLGADGALLVEANGEVLHAEVAVDNPQSAVGAGDALLSGFLAGGGTGEAALRTALAWAATALQQRGTLLGSEIDESSFRLLFHGRPDRDRRLRGD